MGVLHRPPPTFKGIVFVITEGGRVEKAELSPQPAPRPHKHSEQERVMKYLN